MNKKLVTILGIAVLAVAFFALKGEKIVNAAWSYGSVWTPINQAGQPVNDAALIGRQYKKFTNSTTETVVCSAPCVLDSILITSGATSNYLTLADSTTAGGATPFMGGIYMPGSGKNSVPLSGFPPIETQYGLTVDANAADGFEAIIAYHLK